MAVRHVKILCKKKLSYCVTLKRMIAVDRLMITVTLNMTF